MAISKTKSLASFPDLFTKAWRYYWDNFNRLMQLMLLIFPVLFLGAIAIAGFMLWNKVIGLVLTNTMSIPMIWLLGSFVMIVSLISLSGSIIIALIMKTAIFAMALKKDTKSSFKQLWKIGCGKYEGYFKAVFIADLLAFLWSLLLIVPGIIKGLRYSFAGLIAVDKEVKGRNAFKESQDLVYGRSWGVFWRFILPIILFYIGIAIVAMIMGGSSENKMDATYEIISNIASFFLAPLFMIYTVELYHNLKKTR